MPPPIDQDQVPVWDQVRRWERLAAADRLLRSEGRRAVRPVPGEPRVGVNEYWLRMGTFSRMREAAEEIVALTRARCRFDSLTEWPGQAGWLPRAIRAFYPDRPQGIGWCSLLTARMAASFRGHEHMHPDLTITQKPTEVTDLWSPEFVPLDGSEIPFCRPRLFARPWGAGSSDGRWVMASVPRRVRDPNRGVDHVYVEKWFCLARSGGDDVEGLRRGRLPAVPDTSYGTGTVPIRIRGTVLLNIARLDDVTLPGREWQYRVRVIELDPVSALVLSVRISSMPLAAAVLCWSKVEHDEMAELLPPNG